MPHLFAIVAFRFLSLAGINLPYYWGIHQKATEVICFLTWMSPFNWRIVWSIILLYLVMLHLIAQLQHVMHSLSAYFVTLVAPDSMMFSKLPLLFCHLRLGLWFVSFGYLHTYKMRPLHLKLNTMKLLFFFQQGSRTEISLVSGFLSAGNTAASLLQIPPMLLSGAFFYL